MTEYRVVKELWNDSVALYARTQVDGKQRAIVADGLKIVDVAEGGLWPRMLEFPMFMGDTQSLFDALWAAGFRPNNGESSQAHVNAINAHLTDMRTLVFKDRP